MLTLGIAGHVDHGKTSLVRSLTGMETDRLPEEQRRGISIELGFAWLDLPGPPPQRVALVDMPGHERFVKRMIAGASGIDAVVLVVAADEGAMPQGREHLAICQLLGVQRGAVVLTKADLVDASLLELAREDLAELVRDTFLHDAPVWSVSVRDPASFELFRGEFEAWLHSLTAQALALPELSARPFLMHIDRAFSLPGRGTVVAGSAVSGAVQLEQNMQVLQPGATQSALFRVRDLQQQGRPQTSVQAPGRVALNLAGATLSDVPLGSVLAAPGSLHTGVRVDVLLTTLAHAQAFTLQKRVVVHLGTSVCEATVVQLNGTPQPPGTTRVVQLRLDEPMPLPPGAAVVLRGTQRDPRLGQTLGGGPILHPAPPRHRLGDAATLAALQRLAAPGLDDRVQAIAQLAGLQGIIESNLPQLLPAPAVALGKAVKALLGSSRLRRIGLSLFDPLQLAEIELRLLRQVVEFHTQQPGRVGIELEALQRSAAFVAPAVVAEVLQGLAKTNKLAQRGLLWAQPAFVPQVQADPEQIAKLIELLAADGLQPSAPAQLAEVLNLQPKQVLVALHAAQNAGQVVRIGDDMWLTRTHAQVAIDQVLTAFADRDAFSTGELKDVLGLTRKHLIPLAEYLDAERITVRDPAGNRRIRERAREAYKQRQGS